MKGLPPERFDALFRRLFRPLARLAIAAGIPVARLTEGLKAALVDAAVAAAGSGSGPRGADPSDSRISLLTGLHRKDVRRLRADAPVPPRRTLLGPLALVIRAWQTDPETLEGGAPAPLPRPAFEALVRRAKIDLPAATVRDAMLAAGYAEDRSGALVLVAEAAVPAPGSEEALVALEKNLVAHLSTSVDNATAEGAPAEFERALHTSHLSPASMAELDRTARSEAQAMLQRINALARRLQTRDQLEAARGSLPAPTGRFSLGAYIRREVHPPPKDNPEDPA